MRIMTLDCEYTQPSRKCIQIGAAVYDASTSACYGTLDLYVNPGEPITDYITNLTGIRDKDAINAPNILEAWKMLKEFHKKHRCFRNPLVWGSGTRNDSSALYDEYSNAVLNADDHNIDKPDSENFMGFRVIDVKTIYQSVMLFRDSQHGGGLEGSMEKLGLKFEGEPHRALTDAMNTFRLWFHLMKMFESNKKS